MQNSSTEKILVLGSGGFVGRDISFVLAQYLPVIATVRNKNQLKTGQIWFDLTIEESWYFVKQAAPTLIINCIGYGVVKSENDIDTTFQINYFKTVSFYNFLSAHLPNCKLVHIGTAFEYNLTSKALTESSPALPLSYYGISKLLASQYLLSIKLNNPFVILRPFNMFGPYENSSKIIPYLILAQKNKVMIDLSHGEQERDFFYVRHLSIFIINLIQRNDFKNLPNCINIGTGKAHSIKNLSATLSSFLPDYDPLLWNWGALSQRKDENDIFYNASTLAEDLGFEKGDIEQDLLTTIQYYWNI